MHQSIADIAENICSIHTCAEKINGVNPEGIPEYQFTECQVRRINQTIEALDQGMDEDLANHRFMVFKARDYLQTTQNPVLHQLHTLPAATTTTTTTCPAPSTLSLRPRLPLPPSLPLPSPSQPLTGATGLPRSTNSSWISSASRRTSTSRHLPTSPTSFQP